jgi:hypothetical protein
MTQLLKWIKEILCSRHSYGYDMETYIAKHCPTSVADVEYYAREYQKKKGHTL